MGDGRLKSNCRAPQAELQAISKTTYKNSDNQEDAIEFVGSAFPFFLLHSSICRKDLWMTSSFWENVWTKAFIPKSFPLPSEPS